MSTFKSFQFTARPLPGNSGILNVVSRSVPKMDWPDYIIFESRLYLFSERAVHTKMASHGTEGANYVAATKEHALYAPTVSTLSQLYKQRLAAVAGLESQYPKIHDDFVAEFLQQDSKPYDPEAIRLFLDSRGLGDDLIGVFKDGYGRSDSTREKLCNLVRSWRRSDVNWESVESFTDYSEYSGAELKAQLQDIINVLKDNEQYHFTYSEDAGEVCIERAKEVLKSPPSVLYVFDTMRENANKCVNDMRTMWLHLMDESDRAAFIDRMVLGEHSE